MAIVIPPPNTTSTTTPTTPTTPTTATTMALPSSSTTTTPWQTTTTTHPTTTTTTPWPTTTTTTWTTPTTTTTTRRPPRPITTIPIVPTTHSTLTGVSSTLITTLIPSGTSSGSVATRSSSIAGPTPTKSTTGSGSGLPKVAVIGITVAGIIVVGFVSTVLVMKYKSRQRRHKALEQDDMFDHLPIDPSSPAPLMKMTSGTGHHYPHHHGNDNYYQQNMHNQGEMHGHELEPMYENGGEYNQMHHMDHTGGDMHHDYHNHHHDTHYDHDPGQTNMQSDMHNHSHGYDNPYQDQPGQSNMHHQEPGFNQGGNGQGFQGDGGQGFQGDGGQGFQGGDGQGFQGGDGQGFQGNGGQGFQGDGSQGFTQTQPTSTPGSGGMMNQCPTPGDPGISQLNPVQTVGGIQQLPIAGFSGGLPPAPVPPLVNRPNTGSKPRPDSSNQYSILMPTSPTNSTFSGEGGLIDGTSIPAQGAMTIAPLPLDYRHSIASSNDSWEDKSQEYGYSPQSKQALLNQTRYYDASASQHNSGRVFASPNIATISAINPSGVRSPQDATQVDVYGSATSAGFASSLNTFDRRHPQSHEEAQGTDSLFHVASRDSRNPQDNHR